MKLSILFAGVLMSGLMSISVSFAQTKTPVINQRERNQEQRIRQGEASGQLTNREAGKLQSEERQIRQQKRAEKSTGNVTPAERQQLRREENRTSKQIYNKKHNGRVK